MEDRKMCNLNSNPDKIMKVLKIVVPLLALWSLLVFMMGGCGAGVSGADERNYAIQTKSYIYNFEKEAIMKAAIATVDIPDSGVGAYYKVYEGRIIIYWTIMWACPCPSVWRHRRASEKLWGRMLRIIRKII